MLFASAPSLAADANGYTAQYECRAGGPSCNVDVLALGNRTCDQIISTSTPWSSINWSNSTICLEAGDHTSKGTLTLANSGTSGTYKVLRYTRTSDNNDEPWNQGANQAKIYKLDTNGYDYWIVHRLTFNNNFAAGQSGVKAQGGSGGASSDNIIFNRLLIEKTGSSALGFLSSGTGLTLQNSVVRTTKTPSNGSEFQCVDITSSYGARVVNNELYDCNKGVMAGDGAANNAPYPIIENNDIYLSEAGRSDCAGNYTTSGNCGVMEAVISLKGAGTSSNTAKIIHNRLWGCRWADGNLIQSGDCPAISISNKGGGNGADYTLVQNNIIVDMELGIWNYYGGPDHNSYIGNLIYNIRKLTQQGEGAWGFRYRGYNGGIYAGKSFSNAEFYLNTVVGAVDSWFSISNGSNNEMLCNVAIDSGAKEGTDGTGVTFDYNVYYGTTHSGETNKLDKTMTTRANSQSYILNQIIRTAPASSCVNGTESACFLYKVTKAGTTFSSSTPYCTTFGCSQTDGTAVLQAIRGPYIFKRKLRTVLGGESYAIPYARAHSSAQEPTCPLDVALQSGYDIGINNSRIQ